MSRAGHRLAGAIGLAAVLLLALPALASAATFTVNQAGSAVVADIISGGAANGVCDASGDPGTQCTFREALKEANAASNNDTINFSSSVFQGTHPDDNITLGGFLSVTKEATINGGNCAVSGTAKPCVGIDTNGNDGLLVTADGVDVRGLSVFGANADADSVGISLEGDGDTVKGSWLGTDLNEGLGFNSHGIVIQGAGDEATIGGTTGADRNVFVFNGDWITITDADDNRIRGNYFGVRADGTSAAGTTGTGIMIDGDANEAAGNVIGASIDSAGRATTKCDKGCNVIANADDGIELTGDADGTVIKGNFIGLDATGLAAAENATAGANLNAASNTTVGGDTSAERNFITGGTWGIRTAMGIDGLSIERNFIGMDSLGTATSDPPTFAGALAFPDDDPAVVSRNRIAGDTEQGLFLAGGASRVVRNKIGIGSDGGNLTGPDIGILVQSTGATIGEPGAGNTVGNSGAGITIFEACCGSADGNQVKGNYIGVDSNGVSRPNEVGMSVQLADGDADNNVIGGNSASSENVISNSDGNAIQLVDNTGVSDGNQFKRNRGKDNGGLFIDLVGSDGFGNGAGGPNGEIEAPTIDSGTASTTHAEGTDARALAMIYIFRTSSAAGSSPPRINGFVKMVTADSMGDWSTNFPAIPAGQNLTALQLDATDGSSELALAVAP